MANPWDGLTAIYVRAAASGANNGTSWTDAFTALPSTLTRNRVYYMASGTYGAHYMITANSGTQMIYIVKAIETDHGPAGDWNSSYGVGEALWSSSGRCLSIKESRGFFWIDGQFGTEFDPGGYGFRFFSSASRDADSHIIEYDSSGLFANTGDNNNVTLRYIELDFDNGTAMGSNAASKSFLWNPALDCDNWLLQYVYIHDSSGYAIYCNSGGDGWTVDHCYFDNNGGAGGASAHYETVWWREKVNSVVSNNKFRNTVQGDITGWLMLGNNNNVKVIGNLFYTTDPTSTTYAAGGNGIIATWSHVADINDGVYIVNNTLVDIPTNGGFNPKIYFPEHTGEGNGFDSNVYIYNNLLMASSCSITVEAIGSSNAYNAFGNGATPSGSNQQTGVATTIFTSYATDDFTLASHTVAGSTATISTPDMRGTARTFPDRGAYEFGTTAATTITYLASRPVDTYMYLHMRTR